MASISDVAREAGVSVSTVSRALRGLGAVSETTRTRIQAVADELEYIPSSIASGLVTGRTMSVAVVLPFIGQWFFTSVVQGIDDVLRPAGYDMTMLNLNTSAGARERQFHRALLRQRADALISLAYETSEEETVQLIALKIPAIAVGGQGPTLRSVAIDDTVASRLAVQHLLDLGHTHIAHIGGRDNRVTRPQVQIDRRDTWRQMVSEGRGEVPAWWSAMGGFTIDGGLHAGLQLLRVPDRRPTAIFAASDEMAFGVILAAQRLGLRVPQDLSVVGIDDHEFSAAFELTTVHQDPAEQGRIAAHAMVNQLRGAPPLTADVVAPCELVVRASTAPPNPAPRRGC